MKRHSENFDKVRKHFTTIRHGRRLWDANRVKLAVTYGWITKAEMAEILKEA